MDNIGLKKIGEGTERNVYDVGERVWKFNKAEHESDNRLRASHSLHLILQALFPDKFSQTFLTEKIIKENGDGSISRQTWRESQKVAGKKIHPLLGQFFKKRINQFSDELEAAGALTVLDPDVSNFVLQKKNGHHQLVYIDQLNPYTVATDEKPSRRNVDVSKLAAEIEKEFSTPEEEGKKAELLKELKNYADLTEGMEMNLPASEWRNYRHRSTS